MKSFLDHLKEEVLPSVQVADGGLDISKPAVRAAINAAIAGVVSQPAVTPYVVFNRLSKLLAQYHIVLPKRFLEGDKGVEVFEVKQFGHKMGMTDSGEFVNQVPSTHYLFLQYGILSPFGITYAKPIVGGMFKVMARLVDKEELDKLMDMAEITMAEEAECMQAIAKANAPRDPMHDVTSDEKKKGNKAAVATSEKGLEEDKDPCWKGYEMIGMKKKGGRKVPNCVPVEEATDKDRDLSKLAASAISKGQAVKKLPAGRAQNAVLPKGMAKGANIEKGRWSGHGRFNEEQIDENKQDDKKTILVTNKGDERARQGGGVKRIPKKEYDPKKHNMASEEYETQIDELKKSTLASYIKKASHDVATRSAETRGGAMKSAAALEKRDYTGFRKHGQHSDKMFAKSWKRRQGIARAADKLAKEETQIDEKAPPGAKFERMVKHIKKGYAKDGLTAKEKGIAYATAWKVKNREKGE